MKLHKNFVCICISAFFIGLSAYAVADNGQTDMQNRLNEEVLSKQFDVPDDAESVFVQWFLLPASLFLL
jgi:hypothetical protein